MNDYVWTGEILPRESARGLHYSRTFESNLGSQLGWIEGQIQVRNSTCRVRVHTNSDIAPQLLANNIRSTVAGVVDAFGFADGHGRTFSLDAGRDLNTGVDYAWAGAVPELALDPEVRDHQFQRLLEAFRRSPLLGDALADYRRAILEPWDTGFYAYRCIETVQRYWQPDAGRRSSASWEAMRRALGVARGDIENVKLWADDQRHGGRRSIAPDDHTNMLLIARATITSFAEHLLANDEDTEARFHER